MQVIYNHTAITEAGHAYIVMGVVGNSGGRSVLLRHITEGGTVKDIYLPADIAQEIGQRVVNATLAHVCDSLKS